MEASLHGLHRCTVQQQTGPCLLHDKLWPTNCDGRLNRRPNLRGRGRPGRGKRNVQNLPNGHVTTVPYHGTLSNRTCRLRSLRASLGNRRCHHGVAHKSNNAAGTWSAGGAHIATRSARSAGACSAGVTSAPVRPTGPSLTRLTTLGLWSTKDGGGEHDRRREPAKLPSGDTRAREAVSARAQQGSHLPQSGPLAHGGRQALRPYRRDGHEPF
jgi:hypothetical protein